MAEFEPRIIGFLCNWCSYAGADLAGTSRKKYPPNVRVIRVMCSGRVDERLILKAFIAGADGVLVCGCHPGDCHYQKGNLNARRRMTGLLPFLEAVGIGQDRLRLEWVSASEGPKMAATVKDFTQKIKELGPSPIKKGLSRDSDRLQEVAAAKDKSAASSPVRK
jgi:F420-non-reducing hydrogenase iron-sulfur subunit